MNNYLLGCAVSVASLLALSNANAADSNDEGPAQAETDQAAPSSRSKAGEGVGVEEIIVTARRREESILKVPIAISAFNQETLREEHVTSLSDLQYVAPSLSTGSYNSRDALSPSIRGVGQGTNGGAPGVLLYVDEVPVSIDGHGQAVLPGSSIFYDLQNVQVLRGPQGTLFGRNTVGGAVLFVTQKPKNEFGGYVEAGYGNFDDREVEAVVNIPIIRDKLLVRIAGRGEWRDGFTHSLGTPSHPDGQDLDNVKAWSGRLSVTYKPTDYLENDLVLIKGSSHSDGPSLVLTGVNPTGLIPTLFPVYASLLAQQQALGVRTILPQDTDATDNRDFLQLTNTTDFKPSENLTVRNIFGYSFAKSLVRTENDGWTLPLLNGNSLPDQVRSYSEELQLQGTSLEGRLNWVLGGFYLSAPVQPFDQWRFLLFFSPFLQDLQRGERSKSGYAQATYELVPRLKLTGGIRYTSDTRFGELRNLLPDSSCPPGCANPRNGNFSAPTWNVSLDYEVNESLTTYVAHRRGWRSGGFNFLDTSDAALRQFAPESMKDVELGEKYSGRIADIPVSLSSAIFYQDYKQIQVQQIVFEGTVGRAIFSNAAAARAYGVETEGSISPVGGLRLGAYFNWLDFKYTELGPGVDLSFIIDRRPKFKYGLNAAYSVPLSDGLGEVRFNTSWGWESHTGPQDYPGSSIPSQGYLNAGAQWNDVAGLPVDLSLFVTNALDSDKLSRTLNVYNSVGITLGTFAPPRMYGFRLRYRFGG
jgi:iron complex outermembrane recepter protein